MTNITTTPDSYATAYEEYCRLSKEVDRIWDILLDPPKVGPAVKARDKAALRFIRIPALSVHDIRLKLGLVREHSTWADEPHPRKNVAAQACLAVMRDLDEMEGK